MIVDTRLTEIEKANKKLRAELVRRDAQIANLRSDLAEAQKQMPWISEACGDDLWDL